MSIGTMDCSGDDVTVSSGGGSIKIDSLDGIAELDSGGGTVQVIREEGLYSNSGDGGGGGGTGEGVHRAGLASRSTTSMASLSWNLEAAQYR